MSEADLLLKQAQSYAVTRRLLMVVNAVSYVAAIGAQGLLAMKRPLIDVHVLDAVRFTAWPIWALSLVGLFWAMARLRRRADLAGLVDDERTADVTNLSFKAGYWVLLLGITGVLVVNSFVPLDLGGIVLLLLGLGVAAPSLTYAAFYRS